MSPAVRHFARHYLEMLAAMFLGMVVLGVPGELALGALGSSADEIQRDAPALMLLWMATIMTVPMVGWMRHRGHGWRASAEMSASMFLPTFAAIGLLAAGMASFGTAMVLEHAVMLPSMLVAMLLRPAEYAGAHHHHQPQPAPREVTA